ncbi:MAG: fibronectin type III domain-containing protein [Planctomycetota bacterium]
MHRNYSSAMYMLRSGLTCVLIVVILLLGPVAVQAEKPQLKIPSERFDVQIGDSVIPVILEPIDHAAFLAEDQADWENLGTGALRTGLVRPLFHLGMSDPVVLHEIPGVGSLWIAGFQSQAAEGLRLRFTGVDLPQGAELWIYDPKYPDYADGPYTDQGTQGMGDIWSTIFVGDLVFVEYFVPEGAADQGYFVVEELLHMYRPLGPSAGEPAPREGDCHLDVMCYPEYHPLHNATVRLDYIGAGGYSYICSGTQLATEAHDETPYLLTANHCLDSGAYLDSLVITWAYQANDCDGYVPPFSSRPKSSHAEFLATRDENYGDQTLLMILGVVPDVAEWSEWDTAEVSNGTDIAGIHHPTGAYKRISFGGRTTQTFGNPTYFHGVVWQAAGGTIEPGSSGSGLYRRSTKELVGVASSTATGTDCDNHPWGPCSYGKFDRFYPYIDTLLEIGSDDNLEDNDSCAAAVDVTEGNHNDLVVKRLDEDWYHFYLPSGADLQANLTFTDIYGDIDMKLYRGCGGPVVASSVTTTNNESIIYTNDGADDDFYLQVYLNDDVRGDYDMYLDWGCDLPDVPITISASVGTYCSHVEVTWNSAQGATSYKVYRNTTNDSGTAEMIDTTSDTSYDDYDDVAPDQLYYYWVKASNGCGDSSFTTSAVGMAICGTVIGDLNCLLDGVNAYDIDPFILAIGNPAGYRVGYPNCNRLLADCNGDGDANAYDIDGFIALVGGG